jgi:hypothetical protein
MTGSAISVPAEHIESLARVTVVDVSVAQGGKWRSIRLAQRRQARKGTLFCRGILEAVDQSCDAITNELSTEVDQQTETHVC